MRRLLIRSAVLLLGAGLISSVAASPAQALPNNLALTPPMGWNDWNAYGCNVSEALVKQTADKIVSAGLATAGYQYVNIDDCWMQKSRDAAGNLQPDLGKFPDGIAGTAAYVHGKGLKLGIYEDAGTATCAGYPGSLGHEAQDARSFAAWGVDYLKYDNCNNSGSTTTAQYIARYSAMRDALAATGRPIVYSICEWGVNAPWTWAGDVGNLWRTTGDIQANYASMLSIFHQNVGLAAYAGPGRWNDPDMLEVGNGMTATEDRAHFSLWAEMAAPLLAGNNLVTASATTLSILGNRSVIAVDQDSAGRQGHLVSSTGGLDVLAKPLANGDVSVVLFNENAATATISTTVAAIGKSGASSYGLADLWAGTSGSTTGTISAGVPGHGVVMYRVSGGTTGGGTDTVVTIRGAGSGRCLDDPNSSTTNGTQVVIWDCNGGGNQRWTRVGNQLQVLGKCLDAYNNQTTNGTKVEIWDCNGQTNQQWTVNADGTITGVQSGLCLDVTGAATANNTLVELWTCNGGSNQKWTLS
ncbi:alpha-galactosidase [Actinoplanes sp. SE50]|uniref:glycoside hydrolase family 27 protein n=1 Tax=unclassified Actinoplanes TaxID=2626549 RepID=UPI00023EBF9E|nr:MULTISPECIES: glycoside hydrolase family 27 protein [unclassified Actinoplanes]AEV86924.1 ricin B lectin [Actinoplanes sp. SE50/110]ATO85320.1 alpha-galactosidase [Actinoplanes sp. SE50]SLM02731.1 alpha-galactosidase [Actinoplanes sp. SE50/110]